MKYLINSPNISEKEKKYVLDVLKSTWLSSNGYHTKIFENKFSKTVNRKYSLAVQSGTAALHLVLKSMGCGNNDNVIIPNFTCVSSISSVAQCGSVPIILEVERDTLGIDVSLLENAIKKYKPKALQLVHVYGYPARDTFKILKLCKKYKVYLIEDASEALGAKIGINKIGSLGDVSVFSTRSEKMVGVGEGAVISTDNKELFNKISLLASRNAPFRKKENPYWKKYYSDGEGYNYLMPHLLGAVGRAQIEKFKNDTLIKKRKVGSYYRKIFNEKNFFSTQEMIKGNKPVYWLNSIYFKELDKNKVIKLATYLQTKGIEVRSGFWPMSNLKKFNSKYIKGKKQISKEIFEKSIVLPSNTGLKEKDIKYFFNLIKNYLNKSLK